MKKNNFNTPKWQEYLRGKPSEEAEEIKKLFEKEKSDLPSKIKKFKETGDLFNKEGEKYEKRIAGIVFAILFVVILATCFSKNTNQPSYIHQPSRSSKNLLSTDIKNLVGKKIPYNKYSEYGFPTTLSGTDNIQWVAYFPKKDFTIISDKNTDIIIKVLPGKKSQ